MSYIKREDATKVLCGYCSYSEICEKKVPCPATEALNTIPAADVVERKTGKWEEYFDPDKPIFFQHRYRCTACGESNSYGKTDF